MANLAIYNFGGQGVNIVKNKLQKGDAETSKLQNAEFVPDDAIGGEGSLSKRGGLAVLNSSALAGEVFGLLGLALKTTYTRTLYAARGTEDGNTFRTSTDGTTWAESTGPGAPADFDKYTDDNTERDARRMSAIKNFILFAGDNYTQDTDKPIVVLWDGTTSSEVTSIPFGPSATASTPAFTITDWLTANGKLYFAVHDPGGSAPDLAGRVMVLDLETGIVKQIANSFGNGTGETTGGYPACLAFYEDKLWVGLNGKTTTDGIGEIVQCYPDIDETWTSDVSNLVSHISSLVVYKGDLYAGTQSSVSTGAKLVKRTASTGAWTTKLTSGGGAGGNGFYGYLYVYSGDIYAVEYFATTPIIHILKSSDGASWATDRDVDNTDSGIAGNLPGGVTELGDDLYYVFRALSATATDGFILRRTGGSWSKVDTDNLGGPIVTLVERS